MKKIETLIIYIVMLFPCMSFAQVDLSDMTNDMIPIIDEFFEEPAPTRSLLFPMPKELERSVKFWKMIFTQYSSSEIVIRDTKYPDKILSVFESPDPPADMYRPMSPQEEEKILQVKEALISSLLTLHNLEKAGNVDIRSVTEEEANLYSLYGDINDEDRFLAAASQKRLKGQRGASDKLKNAVIFSGLYMKTIREIVEKNNAPMELSLLPFVESMFNPLATSSAGAEGIWQITTPTAHFERLKIDNIVDERRDHVRASEVAVKKLLREHDEILECAKKLGIDTETTVWPQTITAYNAGKGIIFRALKKLKTLDLPKMLFEFRHRRIGFDVRNFYAQFLAMIEIHSDLESHFPGLNQADPIEELALDWKVKEPKTLHEVALELGFEKDILAFLNPRLQLGVIKGLTKIPKEFIIKVPYFLSLGKLTAFLNTETYSKYKMMPAGFVTHKVRFGETLSQIAKRYGTSLDALKHENNLKGSFIRAGANLKIPSR